MQSLKTTIAIGIICQIAFVSLAQDRFQVDNGDTINGTVLGVQNGQLNYMVANNPEFITKTSKIPFGGIVVNNQYGRWKYYRYRPQPYITLSVGPSQATRDFNNLDLSNSYSGFADEGDALKIETGIYIFRNFGVALQFCSQEFEPNMRDVEDKFIGPNENIYSINRWKISTFLFGPIYSARISKSFRFQARFLTIGLGNIRKPLWGYEYYGGSGTYVQFQSGLSETLIDRQYIFGVSLNYKIAKWMEFRLNLDSFRSKTTFSYDLLTTKTNGSTDTREATSTYYVSNFSATIGIAYTFNRKESKKL